MTSSTESATCTTIERAREPHPSARARRARMFSCRPGRRDVRWSEETAPGRTGRCTWRATAAVKRRRASSVRISKASSAGMAQRRQQRRRRWHRATSSPSALPMSASRSPSVTSCRTTRLARRADRDAHGDLADAGRRPARGAGSPRGAGDEEHDGDHEAMIRSGSCMSSRPSVCPSCTRADRSPGRSPPPAPGCLPRRCAARSLRGEPAAPTPRPRRAAAVPSSAPTRDSRSCHCPRFRSSRARSASGSVTAGRVADLQRAVEPLRRDADDRHRHALTTSVFPTTSGDRPNRRCQNPSLITATGMERLADRRCRAAAARPPARMPRASK